MMSIIINYYFVQNCLSKVVFLEFLKCREFIIIIVQHLISSHHHTYLGKMYDFKFFILCSYILIL